MSGLYERRLLRVERGFSRLELLLQRSNLLSQGLPFLKHLQLVSAVRVLPDLADALLDGSDGDAVEA